MRWNPFRRKPKIRTLYADEIGGTVGSVSWWDLPDDPFDPADWFEDYDPEDPPWNRRIWDPDYE